MSGDSGLRAVDLAVGYGARVVARGIGFCAEGGRVLALVGPNGSGKTTLIRTLVALMRPLEGDVSLDGKDPFAMDPRARAALVAYVPQATKASWPFTALETVVAGRFHEAGWFGRIGRKDRDAALEAMASVGVERLAERRVDELSGGERRRVHIARALAQGSRYLVLDEPAAHLDPARQVELMELLAKLADGGKAVILSIHDVNLARRYAHDAVLLLPDGVAVSGDATDVLSRDNLENSFGTSFVLGHHDEYGHFALPVSETGRPGRMR